MTTDKALPAAAREPASPARRVALEMLKAAWRVKSPGMDAALEDARGTLDPRDAALARELAYGVVRHRFWLETVLNDFLEMPLAEENRPLTDAFLLGIYQALYLDRIPAHTVVDETVKLVASTSPSEGHRRLANAIMRKITGGSRGDLLPTRATPFPMRESIPEWIVAEADLVLHKAELDAFFSASNQPAPLALRPVHRPGAPSLEELKLRLRGELLSAVGEEPTLTTGRLLDECLLLHGRAINPDLLPAFREGLVTAEDEGGQVVGWLASPEPGMRVLDLCASPGGKTAHLADLAERRTAHFLATDASEGKLIRLTQTLERLGLTDVVTTGLADPLRRSEELRETFDLVLVDAPCSGLGTLRRHPEIRWRRTPEDLRALARQQGELLRRGAKMLRPGGTLVYSVCTFTKQETDGVCDAFLKELGHRYEPAPAPDTLPFDAAALEAGEGRWRTWPHRNGCDAFFVARFRRKP